MMKKSKGKFSLEVLKYNALDLRKKYQLPYKIVYFIEQLTIDDSIEWLNHLKEQCELMLRVKGFYKRHPDIEEQYNKSICEDYLKFKGYLKWLVFN